MLKEIYPKLNSKDDKMRQTILFGNNKKFERWTGYSVSYWLVKEFRKMNQKFSWEDIMKTKPEYILKSASSAQP